MLPVRANQEIHELLREGYRAEWVDDRGEPQFAVVRYVDLHDSLKNDWLAVSPDPWLIHCFQRSSDDNADETVPALEFLDGVSDSVAANINAVLDAVAKAPPPTFSGGGKWEAMHGDLAGMYEIRVQGDGKNHRLMCLLQRDAADLGGSSIVCIGGLSKPRRQAAAPKDYRRILKFRAEFEQHRTVLN